MKNRGNYKHSDMSQYGIIIREVDLRAISKLYAYSANIH